MDLRGKRILLCDCEASMPLDAGTLAKACRAAGAEGEFEPNTQPCRAQLGNFRQTILGGKPVPAARTPGALRARGAGFALPSPRGDRGARGRAREGER